MDTLQVVVLALVQGLTEFLPISSSGHLVLLPAFVDWDDQGLAFDVAVHVGTLVSVVVYFRRDIRLIISDWLSSIALGRQTGQSMLGWAVLVGTIPGGLCGIILNAYGLSAIRSPTVIAGTTIIFGLMLWWADVRARQQRSEHSLTWSDVLIIGCAQALALIPGTSRSGVTITAGLAVGLTRSAAARFSFLLSIPIITAAGGLKGYEASVMAADTNWTELGAGMLISALSAYVCIHYFLKLLDRVGLVPFMIYRLLLGVVILALV